MKTVATPLRICAASPLVTALALAMAAPAPALARDKDEQVTTNRNPDAVDVAKTPITDLNLAKDPIPPALLEAVANPYDDAGLSSCEDIGQAIGELDSVLGADFDVSEDKDRDVSIGRIAQSAVGSLIPFRSIVREITGAAEHKRDFEHAILAGAVRRGFLKGLGMQKGCAYPARPAFTKVEVTKDDYVEIRKQREEQRRQDREKAKQDEKAGKADDSSGVTFVSEPVVQGTP